VVIDNSPKLIIKQDRWALFILSLLKPWDLENNIPCKQPNWNSFCDFSQSLVLPNKSITSRSTILIILNIAHGLKVSNLKKIMTNLEGSRYKNVV